MKHEKIGPQHLERKAILYVRQSSAQQVLHNRESSALQSAMRERLSDLGWSPIETVDDDLGRSAAGGVMLEACLRHDGKVGRGPGGPGVSPQLSRSKAACTSVGLRPPHFKQSPGLFAPAGTSVNSTEGRPGAGRVKTSRF